jgi:hypothetical protein
MQPPKKCKENFDVSSKITPDEGPSLETSKLSVYCSGSWTNESLSILHVYGYTLKMHWKDGISNQENIAQTIYHYD